ncbi:MAG: Uma2 family endonuclease [Chloroflexi bacterium]|nr:Uma2 family endonuclease [Chloroflexota bacterium]
MSTTTKLTLEQFLALPETKPAGEFMSGEVFQKPMPTRTHSRLQKYLLFLIEMFLEGSGNGEVLQELRCVFGPPDAERAYVPDIVFISPEHLTNDEHHHGPPDLVIEILSPNQPAGRFAEKIHFYLTHGVRLVWIVDPETRTVQVMTADTTTYLLLGDVLDGGDVLPGFKADVTEMFSGTGL